MSEHKDTQVEPTFGENLASAVVSGGVAMAVGYALLRAYQWWKRDEDGPTGGFGIGFGKGNGGININPVDKGNASTGDGGELDGNAWERRSVAGVQGWRRKDVPLPKEEGGPATYQAAVLIMGDGSAIPDLAGWPKTLPVFFVHDRSAPAPDVDGGWMIRATYGARKAPGNWIFDCAATDSQSLTKCVKEVLSETLMIQWE